MTPTDPPVTDVAGFEAWRGRRVIGADDRYIGTMEEVYLDVDGRPPRWAVLNTGISSQPRSFVPLAGAHLDDDVVRVAHPRGRVLEAAAIEPDGELTAEEEERLVAHYRTSDDDEIVMTRSEEQMEVTTRSRVAGRVRLRKVIVTEDVTVTVTVRREEARLEPVELDSEPGGSEPALAAAELDTSGQPLFEVTLYEEIPVVATRVVPRERVRLVKSVVADEREVIEQLRSEQIELIDPSRPSGPEISPEKGGAR